MAWDHLSINKPHLVYIILGGFTSLFMLCSSFIKERLYIGEATVATICGIIFGPHAANLIDPSTWGNTDQITLEFSRIVLVVQCFAVGVELPKFYMEKHWRSVVFLLLPVMTFGWLIVSLFIWWMIPSLNWLQSLCCAACVTATDPVLASSVVGKGKFAKRVPKHLRDLLSAESGCNDGMAFPFIYLALYLIQYDLNAAEVTKEWFAVTILYECVFGAVYGFTIGYIARHGIKWSERNDLVDRESFLVFYFVLALWCAGSGSLLGMDDLLVGFAAGVGFSNDGWFTQKTEESHVSNVIDLLINLAYFVYFGTIIPWEQYNYETLGVTPWRLVVIALFVIFFRRIPIMVALKPLIPDIKTWREAVFAGHFGPIGVGAIFVAILARAELERGGDTTPLSQLPAEGAENYELIVLIWPITTFLVISSIIVHGSSIAVFTLGKHINTLTLTMSYTQANEEGPSWMNRLPRIASQSKSMAKMERSSMSDYDDVPPGQLPPVGGVPGNFLRRQKEEDNPSRQGSRSNSMISRRKKKWDDGLGPGGPISESAIRPQRRHQSDVSGVTTLNHENSGSADDEKADDEREDHEGELALGDVQHDPEMDRIMHRGDPKRDQHKSDAEVNPDETEQYQEGENIIIENEDGDVLNVVRSPSGQRKEEKLEAVEKDVKDDVEHPGHTYKNFRKMLGAWKGKDGESAPRKPKEPEQKSGPAFAYQFGNTIIVEDADGEVVKKYELPKHKAEPKEGDGAVRQGISRMGTWGGGGKKAGVPAQGGGSASTSDEKKSDQDPSNPPPRQGISRKGTWTAFTKGMTGRDSESPNRKGKKKDDFGDSDDSRIRFTIGGAGKRMTKEDFLREIQNLDPKARIEVVQNSNASEGIKEDVRKKSKDDGRPKGKHTTTKLRDAEPDERVGRSRNIPEIREPPKVMVRDADSGGSGSGSGSGSRPGSNERGRPSQHVAESEVERKRREAVLSEVQSEDEEERETPAERRRREAFASSSGAKGRESVLRSNNLGDSLAQPSPTDMETPAERRRREAALGVSEGVDEDSEDDDTPRVPPPVGQRSRGIRFAEEPTRGK